MADSDHSTTLPSVTRRRLMAGVAAASVARPLGGMAAQQSPSRSGEGDPAIGLREQWQRLHDQTQALCRQQQRLETYLVKTVGFPVVKLRLSNGEEMTIHSPGSRPDFIAPEEAERWKEAIEELASRQARWNAADLEVGFSQAEELVRQSEAAEQALMQRLSLTRASSIEGVLTKLAVILCDGEHWCDLEEFPWPHIRSVLNDLAHIHGIDPTAIVPTEQDRNDERHND